MQTDAVSNQTGGAQNSLPTGGMNSLKGSMGKDAFLKLLVTQLQNQDPLKPTDNTEFVAQLAQFSSLEGITNLEKSMEGVSSSMAALQNYSTAGLIGRNVKAEGSQFAFDGKPVALGYKLGGDASTVAVSISDSTGRLIRKLDLGPGAKGEYGISWDGKDGGGLPVQSGAYSFTVGAKDTNNAAVEAVSYLKGPVTGVSFDSSGAANLVVDGSTISKDKIKEIY